MRAFSFALFPACVLFVTFFAIVWPTTAEAKDNGSCYSITEDLYFCGEKMGFAPLEGEQYYFVNFEKGELLTFGVPETIEGCEQFDSAHTDNRLEMFNENLMNMFDGEGEKIGSSSISVLDNAAAIIGSGLRVKKEKQHFQEFLYVFNCKRAMHIIFTWGSADWAENTEFSEILNAVRWPDDLHWMDPSQ